MEGPAWIKWKKEGRDYLVLVFMHSGTGDWHGIEADKLLSAMGKLQAEGRGEESEQEWALLLHVSSRTMIGGCKVEPVGARVKLNRKEYFFT